MSRLLVRVPVRCPRRAGAARLDSDGRAAGCEFWYNGIVSLIGGAAVGPGGEAAIVSGTEATMCAVAEGFGQWNVIGARRQP